MDMLKDLQKAEIYEIDDYGNKGAVKIPCMFNPSEYTITKTNNFGETPDGTGNSPHADITKVGAETLKLSLIFDTYEKGKDVSKDTSPLWELMKRRDDESNEPKQVAFKWGVFIFTAYITNISQRFTMFTHEGVPVRAKVEVSFTHYEKKYKKQNPTSGGGPPERTWRTIAGDRLDLIAFTVYNDSTQWRRIAEYNHLDNPFILRPGQTLQIPKD